MMSLNPSHPRPGNPATPPFLPGVETATYFLTCASSERIAACLRACADLATEDLQNPRFKLVLAPVGCSRCETIVAAENGLCEGCAAETGGWH